MVERIIYTNAIGKSVELNHSAPLILFNLDGVEGFETDVKTNKSAFNDGVMVSAVSVEERIITINGYIYIDLSDLPPDPELRDTYLETERERLKRELYSAFNPKHRGELKIYKKTSSYSASNLVVNQAPIFDMDYTDTNELFSFSVDLLMPFPYFGTESPIVEEFGSEIGMIEFPMDVPPEGQELTIRNMEIVKNIVNEGDTEAPITVEFKANAVVKNPSIFNIYTREFIKINRTMKNGERIVVTTEPGNKRVVSIIDGIEENIFEQLDQGSTFIHLNVGENVIRYNADELLEQLEVYITYKNYYVGV